MGVRIGDKFISQGDSWNNPHGRYGATLAVAKVHKNGNFVFEGDKQQYRPSHDGLYATVAGKSGGWSRDTWRLLTVEVIEKVRLSREWQAARTTVSEAQDVFAKAHNSPIEWLAVAKQILEAQPHD